EVFFGHSGPSGRNLALDYIVRGGRLLVFGTTSVAGRGHPLHRALWRVEGFDSVSLRARPGTGDLVAADGARLAVELADGRVALVRADDGSVIRVLPLARRRPNRLIVVEKPPYLLAGRSLIRVDGRTMQAYDTATGKLQ